MARACAGCAPLVFRCFKGFERFADWLTGAAGPVFIALAVILIGAGGIIFFEVIYPSTSAYLPYWLHLLLSLPCLLIALNLYGHYYLVCTIRPGTPDDGLGKGREGQGWWPWAKPRRGAMAMRTEDREVREGLVSGEDGREEEVRSGRPQRVEEKKCRKCGGAKPERTHHCSVCKSCILRYDHHCPWINQCVGLRNERHFVLFMAYLVLSCLLFTTVGYPLFFPSLDFDAPWPYVTPRICYTLEWVLALALGIAVSVMLVWHVLQASWGETSVEGHDNAYYRKRAGERGGKEMGERWRARWDLGRRRNLEVYFNVGRDGYPYSTLLLPYRILTHSDGRSWERRPPSFSSPAEDPNRDDEDLTDDEEGGAGWM